MSSSVDFPALGLRVPAWDSYTATPNGLSDNDNNDRPLGDFSISRPSNAFANNIFDRRPLSRPNNPFEFVGYDPSVFPLSRPENPFFNPFSVDSGNDYEASPDHGVADEPVVGGEDPGLFEQLAGSFGEEFGIPVEQFKNIVPPELIQTGNKIAEEVVQRLADFTPCLDELEKDQEPCKRSHISFGATMSAAPNPPLYLTESLKKETCGCFLSVARKPACSKMIAINKHFAQFMKQVLQAIQPFEDQFHGRARAAIEVTSITLDAAEKCVVDHNLQGDAALGNHMQALYPLTPGNFVATPKGASLRWAPTFVPTLFMYLLIMGLV